MEWISVKDKPPKFDIPILVWCPIWGRYIATFYRIKDTSWGDWRDFNDKPCLPPKYYMPLPEPPKP